MRQRYLGRLAAILSLGMMAGLLVPLTASAQSELPEEMKGDNATNAVYLVTIENISSQPLTPPVVATHNNPAGFFDNGGYASPGVQGLAENGDVPGLVGELNANMRVGHVAVGDQDGPLEAGETVSVEIPARRYDSFISVGSMLICTNDGFAGVDSQRLPRAPGQSSTFDANSYDAGTEINTENFADMVPPCGPLTGVDSMGQGTGASNPALAENGKITRHAGITGAGDLDPAIHGWADPVAIVTVTRIDRARKYEITVTNNTAGQPLTPPVITSSGWFYSLFNSGSAATPGIVGLAENGDVPGLVAEIRNDPRAYNVNVGNGPVLPGTSQTITVYVSQWTRKLSFASMLICTNDGFAAVNSMAVPLAIGGSHSYDANSYDAGSEINTEAFADMVPPCGPASGVDSMGQGTGASNPALAENGVITRHGGIAGSGDLTPSIHDWADPAATVTVTRVA